MQLQVEVEQVNIHILRPNSFHWWLNFRCFLFCYSFKVILITLFSIIIIGDVDFVQCFYDFLGSPIIVFLIIPINCLSYVIFSLWEFGPISHKINWKSLKCLWSFFSTNKKNAYHF